MLRWLTAGESHGPALLAVLEGLPAGVALTTQDVADALARRRLGYGRGARMSFEHDEVELLGGVRHGLTQGGPVAIRIGNTEWPKWQTVMSADPVARRGARGPRPQRPADPARGPATPTSSGMQKYGFDDARPVLERASARETAARVALGAVAQAFLAQAVGARLVSATSSASAPRGARRRLPDAGRPRAARRRPGPLPRPGRRARHGRRGRRGAAARATPSAASSRCWPTACRRASAATSTGTAGSTRSSPPR